MNQRVTSSILYLDNVHVAFDGFKAINGLSMFLKPGEMRAIIGPNGAGKTTMMDIITGKTKPDKGDVLFDGKVDLTEHDESAIATMGVLSQIFNLVGIPLTPGHTYPARAANC